MLKNMCVQWFLETKDDFLGIGETDDYVGALSLVCFLLVANSSLKFTSKLKITILKMKV